ncbi:MAG: 2-dehydropantoate 2-reductase N-terminal domain-containing protein [Cyanobacteria bacterium P01_A01_bin.68]
MLKCDVVVVALKITHNNFLPTMLASVVTEDGVMLVLQNGFRIEEEVAKIVDNH